MKSPSEFENLLNSKAIKYSNKTKIKNGHIKYYVCEIKFVIIVAGTLKLQLYLSMIQVVNLQHLNLLINSASFSRYNL